MPTSYVLKESKICVNCVLAMHLPFVLYFSTRPGGAKPPPRGPKPSLGPKPAAKLKTCRAMWDYAAQDTDELALREGDVIEIIKKGTLSTLIVMCKYHC